MGYGLDEYTKISPSTDDTPNFNGEYAVIRSVTGLFDEPVSFHGTVLIEHSLSGTFILKWKINGLGEFSGKGIRTGNSLCVTWRGIYYYRFYFDYIIYVFHI